MSVFDYLINLTRDNIKKFLGLIILANRSYNMDDYHTDTMTATYQAYNVGQNNLGGEGTQSKLFVSKSTLIYATQDADLRFNNARNVEHTLLAETYKEFKHDITTVFYKYDTVEGTIYIECEGVLAIEGRMGH